MSSATILILSSSAAVIHTRCFLSPAVDGKEYWRCNTEGDRIHQQSASSNLQAVRLQTGKLNGFARRNASTTAVNAGLGRFSGAVHGNSNGKSRNRRRRPVQEDEGDEHQDGISGSEAPRTTQTMEDQSGESTAGAEECEAFAVAEGVISKDGSSDDGPQSLSYKRYLLELGVSPRPHEKDSNHEGNTTEFLGDFHGMEDDSFSHKAPQLSDEGNLQANGAVLHAGNEAGEHEDMGSGGTKDLDTRRLSDPTSALGNLTKKSDLVTENIIIEDEIIPVEKTSSVDATVFPTPEPKSSLGNLLDDRHTERIAETENVDPSDRIAEAENVEQLPSGSDTLPVEKKRRKKSKSKAVVESTLKVKERGDNERVRASSGGAERPAVPSPSKFLSMNGSVTASNEVPSMNGSVTASNEVPSMNGSVTASNEAEIFEANMDFATVEALKEGAYVKSTSEFSPVAESTVTDGQTSIALTSVVDTNSTIDTSNEDDSPFVKSTSEFSPVAESTVTDGQTSIALKSVVDTNSTIDTSNEDDSPFVKSTSEFSPVAESTVTDGQTSIALTSVVDTNSTIDTSNEDDSPFVKITSEFSPVAESTVTDGQTSIALTSVVDTNSTIDTSNEDDSPFVKITSEFSPVAESTVTDGQTSIALTSVVDTNSTIDTSNEDDSPETPLNVLSKVGSQVVETVLEQAVQTAVKVVPVEIVERAAQVASKVVELPVVVVEQASQVGGQVVEVLPDVVTEQVGQVVDQVSGFAEHVGNAVEHVSDVAEQVANTVNEQVTEQVGQVVEQVSDFADHVGNVVEHVSDVAEQVANSVNEQVTEQVVQVVEQVSDFADQVGNVVDHVSDVAEQVANTVNEQVEQVAESVSTTAHQVAEQVTEFFSNDEDDGSDSDDEFEAYVTSDLPEFRGKAGLDNFIVKQEDQGILSAIYDIYTYMLKQSFPKFAAAMFSAPIIVSGIFTLLYLPEFEGLAFDETARDFFAAAGGESLKLHISWRTLFQVFMFSLSLSTGLQPELAPLSPYTLIVANLNALVAQLVFVFLSGAVFARLSQPSQPLRCSAVALVSASPAQRKRKENAIKVFMARYVLAGPQPCELVDVKVDLTYKYNTHTRTGSYFRATQSLKLATQLLKLVGPDISFLKRGMLVSHVMDENSPLYQKTAEMLKTEDGIFCLSILGLERPSMRSVFHVQHYSAVDNDVIWDAEFEDMILVNKKNERIVDHSRLSMWKPFEVAMY